MADEVCDRTAMVRQLFGEGQRFPDEAGDALPQGVVKTLDLMSFLACFVIALCRAAGMSPV